MVKRLALLVFWLAFALGALWFLSRGEQADDLSPRPVVESDPRPRMPSPETFEPVFPAEAPPRPSPPAPALERTTALELSDPEAPAGAVLGITVLDPELQPVVEAEVLVLDGAGGIQRGRTDLAGRAEFAPHASRGSVFLQPPGAQPRREDLDLSTGERRIVLPAGRELTGWVTVDGAAPEQPITLSLESDQALFDVEGLPPKVHQFLLLETGTKRFTALGSTGPKGRFAFRGLDPAWSGALVVAREYALRDPGLAESELRRVRVPGPAENLVVELTRLPRLTGRVVDEHGEPVAARGLIVDCRISRRSGDFAGTAELQGGGRFSLAVETDYVAVSFLVRSPRGGLQVRRTREEIGPKLDVGDLQLLPGIAVGEAEFVVRVQDPSGAPLPAALGMVDSDPRRSSSSTDGGGEIRWKGLPEGPTHVHLWADGHWPVVRAVTLPLTEPLAVALPPCNRLTVRVLDAQGSPAPISELWVTTGEPAAAEALLPNVDNGAFSRFGARVRDGEGQQWHTLEPVSPGHFVLQRLSPAAELRLAVVDRFRRELLNRPQAPLASEERREVTLEVPRSLRSLVVEVRDGSGAPLVGANVRLEDRADPPRSLAGRTDPAGRFEVSGLAADVVHVHAEHGGLVPAPPREVPLEAPLTRLEFTLHAGRAVTVGLFDTIGRPLDTEGAHGDVILSASRPAGPTAWWAQSTGRGKFAFPALPDEALVLTLDLAGNPYTAELPAGATSARFEVPMHGRIEVGLELPPLADGTWYEVRLSRKASDAVLLKRTITSVATDPGSDSVVFPVVPAGEYTLALARGGFGLEARIVSEPKPVRVEQDGLANMTLRAP